MKFGLLFELGGPPRSSRAAVKKIYDNALEQITLADSLGFDHVWSVEHHFSPPHSYSTAPEIFLTAAAMRTRRIRIGHGIVVCVPPVNHPATSGDAGGTRTPSASTPSSTRSLSSSNAGMRSAVARIGVTAALDGCAEKGAGTGAGGAVECPAGRVSAAVRAIAPTAATRAASSTRRR